MPSVGTGVAAVVTAALGYYVATAIYGALFNLHGERQAARELGVNHSTAALVAGGGVRCAIAPIAEEFFFRGFVFGALRRMHVVIAGRNIGAWIAAIITGILFGLAHTGSASPQYLVPLGFLGFVLCLVRWRTGRCTRAWRCTRQQLARARRQPAQLERRRDPRADRRRAGGGRRDHAAAGPAQAGGVLTAARNCIAAALGMIYFPP